MDHVAGLTFLLGVLYQKRLERVRVHAEQSKLEAVAAHLFSEHLEHPSSTILLPFRLLVVVLALGPAMFLGVLLYFGFGPRAGAPLLRDFLTYTALGVALAAIAINVVLSIAVRKLTSKLETGPGVAALGIRSVGGAVVFTFAAFNAAAALMLEQSWGALMLAIAMIVGVASRFPVRATASYGEK